MSRLIDADELKGLYDPANYEGHEPDENWDDVLRTFAEIRADIDDQPTVDAIPIEFLKRYADWFCAIVSFPEFVREAWQFYLDTYRAMDGGNIEGAKMDEVTE